MPEPTRPRRAERNIVYTHTPNTFPWRERSDDDDPAIFRRASAHLGEPETPEIPTAADVGRPQ